MTSNLPHGEISIFIRRDTRETSSHTVCCLSLLHEKTWEDGHVQTRKRALTRTIWRATRWEHGLHVICQDPTQLVISVGKWSITVVASESPGKLSQKTQGWDVPRPTVSETCEVVWQIFIAQQIPAALCDAVDWIVSPQIHMLKLQSPIWWYLEVRPLEVIRSWESSPHDEISVFVRKDRRETSSHTVCCLSLLHERTQEDGHVQTKKSQELNGPAPWSPASRTVRITFCCMVFCYSSPN